MFRNFSLTFEISPSYFLFNDQTIEYILFCPVYIYHLEQKCQVFTFSKHFSHTPVCCFKVNRINRLVSLYASYCTAISIFLLKWHVFKFNDPNLTGNSNIACVTVSFRCFHSINTHPELSVPGSSSIKTCLSLMSLISFLMKQSVV